MRAVLFFLTTLLLVGCRSIQYVPVETVHTEKVHDHDTVWEQDSSRIETETVIREARPEDSLMIAKLGIKLKANERLVLLLQKELQQEKNKKVESHTKDSVREKSVQVPYPVEKRLTKWQQLKQDWGGWLLLADVCVISYFLYYYIYRKRRR